MGHKLLLDSSGIRNHFSDIPVNGEPATRSYVENQIICAINNYNSNLNIEGVEYADIRGQFPEVELSNYTGLIIENTEIGNDESTAYEGNGYFVVNIEGHFFARKILIYVLFSDTRERGRNVLFTQSIFPAVMEYMGRYIDSPSYTLANHPIYFINIINRTLTARSLLRRLALLVALNIECIEVFSENIRPADVPMEIKAFITAYYENYDDVNQHEFVTDYFIVDFTRHILIIKTNKLVLGEYIIDDGEKYLFKGSCEKFYWMEILPIVVLSVKNGYHIDYTELETFITSNVGNFTARDDKFKRFGMLLQYIKKISLS
jgi:hypothetical protein